MQSVCPKASLTSHLSLLTSATLGIALVLCLFPAAPARADGFIIIERPPVVVLPHPRPVPPRLVHFPLEVKKHIVTCSIRDTVGTTRVDQTFHNPNPQQMEGTYMFPLPETAAVQKFSMWINGKETKGELLDADKARKIYEDIVRKTRDPALLEYVGGRLYKARVFPIPANGDVRVALEYNETIAVSDGLATYRYPLNTEKYSAKPIEDVAITVEIKSQVPIKSVSCPTHTVTISRPSEKEAKVGFEAHHVKPDKDLIVNYLMSEKEFGLSLLTHKPAGEEGYFMARLAPPFNTSSGKIVPKDVTFMLDTSGSMAGEKIEQAKKALLFCLSSLRKEDRFNLITFATDVRPFKETLVDSNSENVASAKAQVEKIEAAGGTAINEALLEAMKMAGNRRSNAQDRPYMIVFITDGEPTVGEREPDKIISNAKQANEDNKGRLFVFGVGHDLNTKLLDRLGDENRGTREYIDEKEDIEVKVSAFFKKIADPVLSDIELRFEGADSFDVYPKTWPDLFHGSELVVVGRYRSPGRHTVALKGKRAGENMTWSFPGTFADSTTEYDFLPRLWATRKIGYLMDEIRLHGEKAELKDEIVKLARQHAIITPYTSYLVVEDTELRVAGTGGGSGQEAVGRTFRYFFDADGDARVLGEAFAGAHRGRFGVEASKQAYGLRVATPAAVNQQLGALGGRFGGFGGGSGTATTLPAGRPALGHEEAPIRQVAGKTFYLDSNGRWVDSVYNEKMETRKLQAFSDEYFQTLRDRPELGKFLALGERVVVVLNRTAYEIQ